MVVSIHTMFPASRFTLDVIGPMAMRRMLDIQDKGGTPVSGGLLLVGILATSFNGIRDRSAQHR